MNAIQTQNSITTTMSEELYMQFVNYIEASQKTVETYTRAIRQFFKYMANNGITNPTRQNIIDYRDELKADHKPTTVQNYITALKLFFQWTSQEGYYPNIAERVKGAKLNNDFKKDYLTSTQVKNILATVDRTTAEGIRDYALISLMVTGGLRTIEVNRATVEDLRTVGDYTVLYLQGKGREEKTDFIKISPQVEKALREYLKQRGTTEPTQPLFISTSNNSKGQAISTRTISGIVKQAFRNAGYDSERLTAHSLRHTAVTLSLFNGESLEQAQQFARHKNISTTQIYAHHLERIDNTCGDTVSNAIFN